MLFIPERIDAWLLSGHQKFSDWFQKLTGQNNFFIAKIAFVISAIILAIHVFLKEQKTNLVVTYIILFLLFFLGMYLILWVEKDFTESQSDSYQISFASYYIKLFVRSTRTVQVLFLVVIVCFRTIGFLLAIDFEDNQLSVSLELCGRCLDICISYLISCTPLPPGKNKVSQWLDKLKNSFERSTAPQPQPV